MAVVENARFSEHLHGEKGLESVYQLMQAETKLLEQMEQYVTKRVAIDIEYAEKLAKLHEKVKLGESNEYTDGSQIEKAWRTYMTESENKAITILNASRTLLSNTIPKINTLIQKKKGSATTFQKNKQKLAVEFSRVEDEKNRLEILYKGILKECIKAKEKLDESYEKPKGQKEWPKLKERFDHVSRKLHMNHNEYMLSLCALNERQKHNENSLIPHLLESMQDIEERYIIPWKEIFQEVMGNSSWCKEEFITSEKELKQSIDLISSEREFLSFLNNHRKNPAPVIPYLFDENLVKDENSTCGLTNDSLAINDLTCDQLQNKKQTFLDEKAVHQKNIEMKKQEVEEEQKTLKDMSSGDSKTIFSTIEQCHQCITVQFAWKELQCKNAMAESQYDIVNKALLNTQQPARPYIELHPPNKSNGVASASATLPHEVIGRPLPETPKDPAVTSKKRRSTLPKLMANLRRKESSPQASPDLSKKTPVNRTPDYSEDDSDIDDYDPPEDGEVTLESSSWYHGNVDRATVSRLLKHDGDFIVREKSDGSGDKVLSVLWRGTSKHIILKPDSEGNFKLEADAFPTIPLLINHHHDHSLVIQASSGVVLVNPVRRIFFDGDGYVTKRDQVKLDTKLGSGHFGEVWRGVLLSKNLPVAVKTCKPKDDVTNQRHKFLEEAEIMKACKHPNVVKLVGVCKEGDPYYIILELCEKGDLLAVLRKESVRLDQRQFFQMAIDIANGMEFLERMQIIHRDLAARNCLVKMDYTVKICDFGMSREEDDEGIYSIKETKEIPFKWCAPEVWHYNTYSSKTDVWSFGVVLWEIFSKGQQPYTGWSNKDAKTKVDEGYRLPPPSGTPPDIYTIMTKCWDVDQTQRYSFSELCSKLDEVKVKLKL